MEGFFELLRAFMPACDIAADVDVLQMFTFTLQMNSLDDFKTVAHNIRVKFAYVATGGVVG